jgi:hypothetical protein
MSKTVTNRPTPDGNEFSFHRVLRIAAVLVVLGAAIELVLFRTWMGALSLTAAGLVAMINFRWLEVIVNRVVQPGKSRFDRWTALRILGRLTLLAGILAALVILPRVDAVAVAFGFSTMVVALVIEGLRQTRVGGG